MDKLTLAIRVLLGLLMFVFGLNKFLDFMPPLVIPGDGGTLIGIYFASGFMKIIGSLEVVFGLALLLNKYVPLALTFLIAILFNATIFHMLHDLPNIAPAIGGLLMGLYLVYAHKVRFISLLSA